MGTNRLLTFALLLSIAIAMPASAADVYPNRPIRIIVPFTGGSGSDASARYFAEKMAPILGQAFIVENRPGADGAIGMMAAKSAPADGYTVVQGGISPSVVNAVLVPNLGYDPLKDFVPLTGYGRNMNVIIVSNEAKQHSFKELLADARTSSRPLNMGTFSTTLALSGAWMAKLANVKLNNIPYRGQGPVMTEVIGNQLDFGMVDLGGASPLIRAGKLRALAVTGEKRHPDFPKIPTVQESGVANYSQYSWNAFYVRAETPAPIRAMLGEAIRQVMTREETVRSFYAPKGTEGIPLTPAQMQKLQEDEIARFRRIAAQVGPIDKN